MEEQLEIVNPTDSQLTLQKQSRREVSLMLSVKCKIESILYFENEKRDNVSLCKIQSMVLEYLRDNCNHDIIEDSIDVGIEKSQTIYFCKFCETCFDGAC